MVLSTSTSWHQRQSLGLVYADGMDLKMWRFLVGLSFSRCSIFSPCISFRQEQFWFKIVEMDRWSHVSTGAMPIY